MNDPRRRLTPDLLTRLSEFAGQLADQCRGIAHTLLASGINPRRKTDGSFVTDLDLAIEQHIRAAVRSQWPEHGVLGEELPPETAGGDWQWIIDPVDGTEELVRGRPFWGSITGLFYRQAPVLAMIDHAQLDQRLLAVYGQGACFNGRRLPLCSGDPVGAVMLPSYQDFLKHPGGDGLFPAVVKYCPNYRVFRSCYGHGQVALGGADAGMEIAVKVWDLAATRLLMEETGRDYYSFSSPGFNDRHTAIFGRAETVASLRRLVEQTLPR